MSWIQLGSMRPAAIPDIRDSIAVRKTEVAVRICHDTMAKLGWKQGDRIGIMVGTEADIGLLRLIKVAKGGWLLHATGSKWYSVRVGRVLAGEFMPSLPAKMSPHAVKVAVVNGSLMFRLPWMTGGRDPHNPFAIDNIKTNDGGHIKLGRPPTFVPTSVV